MAKRYGHNPNVVGWQLDNEYADDSFDPEAKAQFHEFLRKKYGTIENLNAKWTTAYWSQTYNDFDQIPSPRTRTKTRPAARLAALRQRSVEELLAEPDRGHPSASPIRASSSPPTPWAGSTTSTNMSSTRCSTLPHGTIMSAARSTIRREWRGARPDPRLQAQELLGDGD